MLKKLRITFIVTNMTIVTVMLCLIFGLLYLSTSRNMERESIQMMNSIAMNPIHLVPPNETGRGVNLPYFSIMVNGAGEVIRADGGFFDLSDRDLLSKILKECYETQTDNGILKEYHLRFSQVETPMGRCFVFADITSEQAILRNLIRTFLLTGMTAFLIFLGISVMLANRAVKPVEKAWQQQKQFVADASHELKTPITVIMTDAELLHSAQCSDPEREELSESILTISGQMRGLVEDLLELARIDNGTVKDAMQQIHVSDLLQEAALIFEPVFFEKEMLFSYEITPDIEFYGNGVHLKQLVHIFLDNAMKYGCKNGKVFLSFERISSKKCLLTVSNQGEPIEEEDLKHLFKRFYRVDKARTSRHSYGLGLSIAEGIAQEHNGKVWAESKDGYNSFFAEFPV